jgi:NAD(P)H dehydrogenase (quinone)
MAEATVAALRKAGHDVVVSDLCAQGFRADIGRHDMTSVADGTWFHVQAEQAFAVRERAFAADIRREQDRLAAADNLILQFPLWWGGPPAILKGWIDRVLAYGFGYVDGRRFDSGLFRGRRAMLSVTTGGTPERFSEGGVYGPIGPILMPIEKLALQYMGFDLSPAYVAHSVPRSPESARLAHLDGVAKAALAMAEKPVLRGNAHLAALDQIGEAAWTRTD